VLRTRFVHRHWQRLTLPNIVRAVRARGFGEVDLLYFDTPLQAFWLSEVRHGTSVFRIMDRASGFHGVAPEFLRMEQALVRAVDLVVFAARSVEGDLVRMGAGRLLHLPNGVDFDHFRGDHPPPPVYASIPGPRVVYVGAIEKWFDHATVNHLAERMPDVSFVVVGPASPSGGRILDRDNVHLLGPRAFDDLPGYLQHADVGLIPFDVARFPEAVNAVHPLKLYEYLACGLPVVATRWEELEQLGSPVILCDGVDDFESSIRRALADPADIADRIEFAREADWSARLQSLLDALVMRVETT
jgi:glycosyltransferase involved in cell wall biosynthesis